MGLVTALLALSLIDSAPDPADVITLPASRSDSRRAFLPGLAFDAARGSRWRRPGAWLAFAAVAKALRRGPRRRGLGQGDWKLAALLAPSWAGRRCLLTVLLASVAGTIVAGWQSRCGVATCATRSRSHLPGAGRSGSAVFLGDSLLGWYRGALRCWSPGRRSLRMGAVLGSPSSPLFEVLAVAQWNRSQRSCGRGSARPRSRQVETARRSRACAPLAVPRPGTRRAASIALGSRARLRYRFCRAASCSRALRGARRPPAGEADRRQLEIGRTSTASPAKARRCER